MFVHVTDRTRLSLWPPAYVRCKLYPSAVVQYNLAWGTLSHEDNLEHRMLNTDAGIRKSEA